MTFFDQRSQALKGRRIWTSPDTECICYAWIHKNILEAVNYIIKCRIRNSSDNFYWLQNLGTNFIDMDIEVQSFFNHNPYELIYG